MKANEFVKKFGLNTAKSVLSNENSKSCRFYCHNHEYGLMALCQVWVDDPKDSNVDFVSLDELEKLIESHELVSKATPEELYQAEICEGIWCNHRLAQAIQDVESYHVD